MGVWGDLKGDVVYGVLGGRAVPIIRGGPLLRLSLINDGFHAHRRTSRIGRD